MKYFDENTINKGKGFINIGVAVVILLNFIGLADMISRSETIRIKHIILTIIILGVIAFYYKGNKLAFEIVSLVVTVLPLLMALLVFSLVAYFLEPSSILNGWAVYLIFIILITYVVAIYFMFYKIGWFKCIEEYRLYRNENKIN